MGLTLHDDVALHAVHDETRRRPTRIVVGVDFGRASLAVASWAGRHFGATAELTLVHVAPPAPVPNVARLPVHRSRTPGRSPDEQARALRGALHGLASLTGGARTRVAVLTGDAATELAAYADSVAAALIITGPTATSHLFLRHDTATTERLLVRTYRPVLIARDPQPSMAATVLAVVDGDAGATSVLDAAWMLARPSDGRIAALHVADGAPATDSVERIERWLRAANIPRPRSTSLVATGDRWRAILRAARDLRAGVVAVGARRQSGGTASTNDADDADDEARTIVRVATCSVLVVPHASVAFPRNRGLSARTSPE
jgi:nucleotide-binding universal stress UspA family protein